MWRRGLDDPGAVTDADLRGAQDCILGYRQTNARVPDRFYWLRRNTNEALILDTGEDLVEQARLRGHVVEDPGAS